MIGREAAVVELCSLRKTNKPDRNGIGHGFANPCGNLLGDISLGTVCCWLGS